ncbi:hypothetical protein ACH5RR_016092 [Cinchona calisaya]|uniref:Transmembrane protein n=1 Tax=Cinchona calisaya TaxID=153742 RepID=A0ABD2ZVC8_9GENT
MADHIEEEGGNGGKPMGDDKMKQGSSSEEGKESVKEADHNVDGVVAIISELSESIEKHKDRIQTLETTVFQLANYYLVFQGVFFTAVFNGSSHIKCRFRYLAFSLSLIAAFLNLIALIVVAWKHQDLLKELDAKEKEWNSLVCAIVNLKPKENEPDWKRNLRFVLLILAMSSLALFAGFNLHGTWKILCYENQQCICSSSECIKLCS